MKRALPGLLLLFTAACALAQAAINLEDGNPAAAKPDGKTVVPYDFTPVLRRGFNYVHWDPTFNFTAEGSKPFVTIFGKLAETNDLAGSTGYAERDYAKMELPKGAVPDVLHFIDIFTKFADKLQTRPDLTEGETTYYRVLYGDNGGYADIIFSHNHEPMLLLSCLLPTEAYSFGTDAFGTNEPTCFQRNPYRYWDFVGLSVADAKVIQYILTDLKEAQFQEYMARQAKPKVEEPVAQKPTEPEAAKLSELEIQQNAEHLRKEAEKQALEQKAAEVRHRQLDALFNN